MESVVPAVAAGIKPTETASGSVVLRNGRRYVTLAKADVAKTAAGNICEPRSKQTLPAGGAFNPEARAHRDGNTEYIRGRSSKERVTRHWEPATSEAKFTALGRAYCSEKRSQHLVPVPVRIEGWRNNGTTYELRSYMPAEMMGLPNLSVA